MQSEAFKIMEKMLQDLNGVTVASAIAAKALSELVAMQNMKPGAEFEKMLSTRVAAWSKALGALTDLLDDFHEDGADLLGYVYGKR